jgi:hypothetical protein
VQAKTYIRLPDNHVFNCNVMAPPFPSLPQPSAEHGPWSTSLLCAHKRLAAACAYADTLLSQDNCEPLRFKIQIEQLTNDCLPLIEAMELMRTDLLPREWIDEAVKVLAKQVVELQGARAVANEQCVWN